MNNIDDRAAPGDFDLLTPELVLRAVEGAYELSLTGHITQYNSYINRVYEVHDEDGQAYMAKFYRPGRWSEEAILEEHAFIRDCVDLEIPTVAPLPDPDGETLATVELVGGEPPSRMSPSSGASSRVSPGSGASDDGESVGMSSSGGMSGDGAAPGGGARPGPREYHFALFPKRGGRNFDAESEEDWLRLGALVGRMHTAARRQDAVERDSCLPRPIIEQCLRELGEGKAVHPDLEREFYDLAGEVLETIEPLFEGVPLHRVHGDCHRGNILERPGEGLLLIDFDDMMTGPAVQDLWLLLPGRAGNSPHEFNLIVEGYERFLPFDFSQKRLIEALRAMRMLYYLAWSVRQRGDRRFRLEHPHWGGKAFWIKEIEDLREQLQFCVE